MFTLLVVMTNPALACPEEVAEATTQLESRRAAHREARTVARDTDWDRYLALDDRDAVLARQARAFEELRLARAALRDARRHLHEVDDTEGVACEPAETETKSS